MARRLAAKTHDGHPALLNASASSCVRVCLAARNHLNIEGTLFRVGGEPFTEAKANVVKERGCRALVHYGMTEVGRIGLPCAAPRMLDDVHLAIDRLAVDPAFPGTWVAASAASEPPLTTLHPGAPTLLINAETGDYGTVDDRDCGCAIGDIGFSRHLHSMRRLRKVEQRRDAVSR